jgi:hypothetical protein
VRRRERQGASGPGGRSPARVTAQARPIILNATRNRREAGSRSCSRTE